MNLRENLTISMNLNDIIQYRLAKITGITQSTISDLQSGKNTNPSLDTL